MAVAPRIAMVAGEASGDLLAEHLIEAIRRRLPDAQFMGIGGPRMIAQGFDAWWPSEKLSVRGYVEVLKHYPEIKRIHTRLGDRLLKEKPDLFIGVDAPDFNLDLEIRLRENGVRTAHFVSPSIWAWRGGRMKKIKRAAGHMLCVFPFEEPLYRAAGVPATYVGHPLADVIPMQPDRAGARDKLGLRHADPVIALLPGSRQSELQYLGERFAAAALKLARRHPELQFVVPLASEPTEALWDAAVRAAEAAQGKGARLQWTASPRDAHAALAACDIALAASGTVTLETALFKRPMVVAYNMAPLSWRITTSMAYLPYGSLPNILCGEFVVPEFAQEESRPEILAQALDNLLGDAIVRARLEQRFTRLHGELKCGMAPRAAAAIVETFFPGA